MNSFQEIFQQQQQHRGIISIFCVAFFFSYFLFFQKTYFGQCRRRPSICEFYCTFFLASQNASLGASSFITKMH